MPAILILCQRYNTSLTPIPAWSSLSSAALGYSTSVSWEEKGKENQKRIHAKKKIDIYIMFWIQLLLLQPFIQSLEMDLPHPGTFPASLETSSFSLSDTRHPTPVHGSMECLLLDPCRALPPNNLLHWQSGTF